MGQKLSEKPVLLEKAWKVWHEDMIGYGPEIANSWEEVETTYAKSASRAKTYPADAYDWELKGDEPKYTDLKVRRYKPMDKVMYRGNKMYHYQIEDLLRREAFVNKRREAVEKYPDDAMFYIQNGYVGNAILFWGLGGSGYTCKIEKAQKYTKQEVLDGFVNGREEDRILYAGHVESIIVKTVDSQFLKGEFVH
jgi:hypothetical protein